MKLLNLLDASLNLILIDNIKEEAIGDLWEVHYRLVSQKKPWLIRNFLILEMALQLVYASLKISLMNNNKPKNLKKSCWLNSSKLTISDLSIFRFILISSFCVLILSDFNKIEINFNHAKFMPLDFLQKSP